MSKYYKCPHCGAVVEKLNERGPAPSCCGGPMVEIKANTTEAAVEKHIPEVTVEGNVIKAVVGSVVHPMTEAHYIEWIAVKTDKSTLRHDLKWSDEPKAEFVVPAGEKAVEVLAYCNLHGLWGKTL